MGRTFLVEVEEVGALRLGLELSVGCSGGGSEGRRARARSRWAGRRCGACRGGLSCCTGREHQPGRGLEQEEEEEEEGSLRDLEMGLLSSEVEEELYTSCLLLGHT